MSGWLPIESAPKDGSEIWLFTPEDKPDMVVGFWSDAWGGWDWSEAIVSECAAEELLPTHWMSKPAAPEAA